MATTQSVDGFSSWALPSPDPQLGWKLCFSKAKLLPTSSPRKLGFDTSLCPSPALITQEATPKPDPLSQIKPSSVSQRPPPSTTCLLCPFVPPAPAVAWSLYFPSKIIPNFHYSCPTPVGTKAGLAAPSLQGRRAQEPVPFQA